jgi:tripartite-type tricarboxylate transporter receptor subunit TctC
MTDAFSSLTRRQWLATSGAVALAASPWLARAQADWPTKPLRLVVPFAPGGSSEIVARAVAGEMAKTMGQNVFVDNKPGAAGNIAMQEVANSTDGHTLILGHIGTMAVNPYIFAKVPYEMKDFIPITLVSKVPSLYVVHPDLPVKNLTEFVAYAKARPGQLNYGSAGNGSAGHLAFEYLKMATGIFVVHVPYRGTGPMLTDLLSGRLAGRRCGGTGAAAVHQGRQAALHRHRLDTAPAPASRCAHCRRAGLQGLRNDPVVRPAGARQMAQGACGED